MRKCCSCLISSISFSRCCCVLCGMVVVMMWPSIADSKAVSWSFGVDCFQLVFLFIVLWWLWAVEKHRGHWLAGVPRF